MTRYSVSHLHRLIVYSTLETAVYQKRAHWHVMRCSSSLTCTSLMVEMSTTRLSFCILQSVTFDFKQYLHSIGRSNIRESEVYLNRFTNRHDHSRGPRRDTHSSLAAILGLPSVDDSSHVNGSATQRSRRGKYPVVELWRSNALEEDRWGHPDDCGSQDHDDLHWQSTNTHGAEDSRTALEHLQTVLRLGREQADAIQEGFPALAEVQADRLDVRTKLRFVRHTMRADPAMVAVSFCQFFGHPLERHIAPRHAFLVANGRPSGAELLEDKCRGLRRALELPTNRFVAELVPGRETIEYRRFEQAFLRGPFDAARRGDDNTLRLLRSHGWDCSETDRRGRTALFWAAGAGSVGSCEALTDGMKGLDPRSASDDKSTPLHWAATGVEARRFGIGGHIDVCRWLHSRGADSRATTVEGNTVLMWAAWAGGLEVTRWVVEEAGADLEATNVNGCSAAHWAASGGDLDICRYLDSCGVDFTRRNKGGNDPLNHAVAYGRRSIAAWLLGLDDSARGGSEGGQAEGVASERRRDDPVLLDLARLTGDGDMHAFLKGR